MTTPKRTTRGRIRTNLLLVPVLAIAFGATAGPAMAGSDHGVSAKPKADNAGLGHRPSGTGAGHRIR
jgi:hypothetical protein